jgi:hypothetical protein
MIAKRWGVQPEKFPIAANGAGQMEGWRTYCGLVEYHPELSGRLFMSA